MKKTLHYRSGFGRVHQYFVEEKLKKRYPISLHVIILLLLVFTSSFAFAQSTITGKVADEKGESLIGVTVKVKTAAVAPVLM
jgi:hypothetical protein